MALPLQTSKAVLCTPKGLHQLVLPWESAGLAVAPHRLAMPRTWAGVRTWSQRLNWAMSPTKAWVASKRPLGYPGPKKQKETRKTRSKEAEKIGK